MTRVSEHIQQTKDKVYDGLVESTFPSDLDLVGWVAPDFMPTFSELAADLTENALIIEVGTWKGASCNLMADKLKSMLKDFEIVAVDTWSGSEEFLTWGLNDETRGLALKRVNGFPTVYFTFLKNVILQGNSNYVTPFPMSSTQAAGVLKYYNVRADIIYIDGSHEEKPVYSDLESFWPLVKENGCLFGDDYNWDGVKKAVDKFVADKHLKLELNGIVWMIAN